MEPISEELVEETWQEVSDFTPEQGSKEMRKLAKSQPELIAFMLGVSNELEQDVKELALYMFFVVYRIFEKAAQGNKLKKLSSDEIMDCYEENEDLIEGLEGVDEIFFDRIARVQVSRQPYVMKYVVDTLVEMPDEEDPVALTEDDIGAVFLLLKTVVDLLDQTAEA